MENGVKTPFVVVNVLTDVNTVGPVEMSPAALINVFFVTGDFSVLMGDSVT